MKNIEIMLCVDEKMNILRFVIITMLVKLTIPAHQNPTLLPSLFISSARLKNLNCRIAASCRIYLTKLTQIKGQKMTR